MPRPRLLPETDFWTVYGAKIPVEWAVNLEAHAKAKNTTRHGLVRQAVDTRTKEVGTLTPETAAQNLGMNKSQFIRDALEKVYPDLCPPIPEYRGDGARYSTAGRRRTTSVTLSDTQYIKLAQCYAHWTDAHPMHGLDTLDKFVVAAAIQWANAYMEKHNLTTQENDSGNQGHAEVVQV